jgi:hypothetical protein
MPSKDKLLKRVLFLMVLVVHTIWMGCLCYFSTVHPCKFLHLSSWLMNSALTLFQSWGETICNACFLKYSPPFSSQSLLLIFWCGHFIRLIFHFTQASPWELFLNLECCKAAFVAFSFYKYLCYGECYPNQEWILEICFQFS